MQKHIIYEQPLNERIRTFLRLEFLFDTIKQRRDGTTQIDSRDTIEAMIDVIELLSRFDIKRELIKELERHINSLTLLVENPNVDQKQLNTFLTEIHQHLSRLHDPGFQPGKLFSKHELLVSVKQRSVITGGCCNFDLPNYHHWLNKPVATRMELMDELYTDIEVLDKSIILSLHILRNSSSPTDETAESGFFQKNIGPKLFCRMLQIILPKDSDCYPEISAGKHRFSIRFMKQDNTAERPTQTDDDVEFKLSCCLSS